MDPVTAAYHALTQQEQAILDRYARLLSVVPGSVSVWTTRDEGRLHFHTLVPPGRHYLRAVLEAERALLREFDPALVDFDIYQDAGVIRLMFSDRPPVYRSR